MNFLKSALVKPIICVGIVLAVSACSDNESAQTYITKAESLIVEKQNSAAIIALKNALKVDAKNAQARFLLGQLYLQVGDAENAAKELERANKFKYDINKLLPLLARAYMLTESDEDILSLTVQEKLLSTANTQYLAYKTIASLRTGDNKLAREVVNAALAISTTDGYSMLANAYIEFSQQKIAHASTLVERILTATPNNADALMLQGQIATVEKNYVLAIESYQQYFLLQPNSGKVQLFIADALMKNGQFKEAEEIADAILAKIPTQPFLQYIKAMARFENKDYKAAISLASQSLNSGFNSFSLRLVAGASAFYLKNYQQSNNYLKDLMPYLPTEHPARRMLAVSQLQLGLIDDISETLGDYDATNKESAQFLATLSYGLLEVGAYEKAKEMASYAANLTDMTAEETARAGVLKLMMNDPSGIENLELALQQNPELVSAELALAFASIKLGNLSRAKKIADKWLQQYPNKAGGYNLQAKIFFRSKKLKEGKTALEKSLQLEPNNVYALTEMVKLANYQKDTEQATLLTEQALNAHPNNIEILRQYFSFHKNEAGLKVITKAQQDNINNVNYGVLLAEALMHLEQFKQASSVLDGYQLSVKTPKRYWQLALAANAKQPDGKDIYSILDKWHKNNAYHIEPVFLLVNYWRGKKSPDRALNVLEQALKKHPKNLMIHLVKMQVLLNSNRVSEAKKLLVLLDKFEVNENLLAGIEGRILLLDKQFAAAIPKLQQQYQAKPNSGNARYLAFALEGNNQKAQAIELLESFSEKDAVENKLNPRISLSLANMYLAEHQDKAIAEYERLIKVVPNSVVALNNLSWLYMEHGKYVEALKYSKQAYVLAANISDVVDTYAQALLKSDKKAKALVKAKEAYELSKGGNVDISLNFAETLLANNRNQEAEDILSKTVAVTAAQKEKKQRLLQ
ncbi:MAG: PEP-CTERM system TPR-repeat protein PrsT [Gammaproteobacteria bacterium]|nr:MAG: PEP-CTERM system TPR-repeat protein PrsT [Gammaproteobacteria bacterium]